MIFKARICFIGRCQTRCGFSFIPFIFSL